jgi:hypothetical protein
MYLKESDLTPGITRRPASYQEEFNKQRVGGRVHAVVLRRRLATYVARRIPLPAELSRFERDRNLR